MRNNTKNIPKRNYRWKSMEITRPPKNVRWRDTSYRITIVSRTLTGIRIPLSYRITVCNKIEQYTSKYDWLLITKRWRTCPYRYLWVCKFCVNSSFNVYQLWGSYSLVARETHLVHGNSSWNVIFYLRYL